MPHDDLAPLATLEPAAVHRAVADVAELARRRQVQIFCGSLVPWKDGWCNAALTYQPEINF